MVGNGKCRTVWKDALGAPDGHHAKRERILVELKRPESPIVSQLQPPAVLDQEL